ncbi:MULTISPECIES: hypothetical protein [unclassified Pseudomonas]|jgi:hypothetical protein|uniref:hypothetical protein n=1 Tax=unclassified Pseudomonas TaxID=196821 RepID=UPI002006CEDA|nr:MULTISPECIES: hypothetical protein [unclassified Pseudomonas]MCK6189845.1 hypothetical protein [Pseudomonas sp. EYE_354]WLH66771.1 hypothetical protein PSH59_16710 [Pseudomonas sp. FP2309]
MRPTTVQPFLSRSWAIALLIGMAFVGLEYALKLKLEDAGGPRSWLDLTLLLCGYLFMFCLKPIQKAVQRKLCQRTAQKAAG